MAKQRAIKLNLNRTFEEKNFPVDRNIVKDGQNEVVYEPTCVFSEKKTKLFGILPRFWKGARHIIFFVDGAFQALKFKEVTDDMNPFWTQQDEKKLIKREMRKRLAEDLAMKMWQFFAIMGLLIFSIILNIVLMQYFGVF